MSNQPYTKQQLIGIDADRLSQLYASLDGIVDEFLAEDTIKPLNKIKSEEANKLPGLRTRLNTLKQVYFDYIMINAPGSGVELPKDEAHMKIGVARRNIESFIAPQTARQINVAFFKAIKNRLNESLNIPSQEKVRNF